MSDMTPRIKEMVDAAVKEFETRLPCMSRSCDNNGVLTVQGVDGEPEQEQCEYCHRQRFPEIEWLRTTLTSITENAVASERARLREGVEGMKRKHWVFECNGAHGGKGCYETFCDDKSRLGECTSKDAQTIRAHNAALTATLEALEKI